MFVTSAVFADPVEDEHDGGRVTLGTPAAAELLEATSILTKVDNRRIDVGRYIWMDGVTVEGVHTSSTPGPTADRNLTYGVSLVADGPAWAVS